jgi:hypothetical protein
LLLSRQRQTNTQKIVQRLEQIQLAKPQEDAPKTQ